MAAYAEGMGILRAANVGRDTRRRRRDDAASRTRALPVDINIGEVAEVWRRGSVVASWLLDLTATALLEDPSLSKFAGRVSDSGEGAGRSWRRSTRRCRRRCSQRRCARVSARAEKRTSRTSCFPRCAFSSADTWKAATTRRVRTGKEIFGKCPALENVELQRRSRRGRREKCPRISQRALSLRSNAAFFTGFSRTRAVRLKADTTCVFEREA